MKKLIMTIAIATMLAVPAMAQVFLDDEAAHSDRLGNDAPNYPSVPEQNVNYDQYAPVGGGVLLLAGLAGAYAVAKRKKNLHGTARHEVLFDSRVTKSRVTKSY